MASASPKFLIFFLNNLCNSVQMQSQTTDEKATSQHEKSVAIIAALHIGGSFSAVPLIVGRPTLHRPAELWICRYTTYMITALNWVSARCGKDFKVYFSVTFQLPWHRHHHSSSPSMSLTLSMSENIPGQQERAMTL